MSEAADATRVIAWANSNPRKPAVLAYWIELAEQRQRPILREMAATPGIVRGQSSPPSGGS